MKLLALARAAMILAAGLGMTGCASVLRATPPSSVINEKVEATAGVSATASISPTDPPVPIAPPAIPSASPAETVTLTATKTLRDQAGGFEIDYPVDWAFFDVTPEIKQQSLLYAFTMTSWQPEGAGSQGIPEGGAKVDVVVDKARATIYEEAIAKWKEQIANAEFPVSIQSESEIMLGGGLKATRLVIKSRGDEAVNTVTWINGNIIVISGLGDLALIDAIARTLRPIKTG